MARVRRDRTRQRGTDAFWKTLALRVFLLSSSLFLADSCMVAAQCDHLYVYLDISGSVTESGNYKKSVDQVKTLLLNDYPSWLPCIDIHVLFFGERVLDGTIDERFDRVRYSIQKDGQDLSKFLAIPFQERFRVDSLTKSTNIKAVFDSIAREAEGNKPGRRMFLVFSDFAHDLGSLLQGGDNVVADRASAREIFEDIVSKKSVWSGFGDPASRTFMGVVLPAGSSEDRQRQNAIRSILQGIPGLTLLDTPSSSELLSSLVEGLAPLVIDATRSSNAAGWDLSINNLWPVDLVDIDFDLLCGAEDEAKTTSKRSHFDPIQSGKSVRTLSDIDVRVPIGPGKFRRCTMYVYGRPLGGKEKSILGSVHVFQGVFIDLDLDYVRPEVGFSTTPGSATVIFKLRGQLEERDKNCDTLEVALSARRGDATIEITKPSRLSDTMVAAGRAGQKLGACTLHPLAWTAFKAVLPMEATARHIPLCAHEPPALVFRVTALPVGESRVDEEIWRHRHEESDLPKHGDEMQGHEITREVVVPVTASVFIMLFMIFMRRGILRPDYLINMFAIVAVGVTGIYAMIHEFTDIGRQFESWMYMDARKPLWVMAISIIVFLWICSRHGVFTVDVDPATAAARFRRETAVTSLLFKRLGQCGLLLLILCVGAIVWTAMSEDEIERICAYQDVFIARTELEKSLGLTR